MWRSGKCPRGRSEVSGATGGKRSSGLFRPQEEELQVLGAGHQGSSQRHLGHSRSRRHQNGGTSIKRRDSCYQGPPPRRLPRIPKPHCPLQLGPGLTWGPAGGHGQGCPLASLASMRHLLIQGKEGSEHKAVLLFQGLQNAGSWTAKPHPHPREGGLPWQRHHLPLPLSLSIYPRGFCLCSVWTWVCLLAEVSAMVFLLLSAPSISCAQHMPGI
ncbi:uncharacterized protein LOC115305155 [Suricata suricatta]|uniref:uncharacterized protein LOC115305155 n=1 Tax=Suricata suricatta TaxID=37032 RepID=UPI001155E0A0|nr:uncharacterized protein LOC115305155 [Suricata suricatta]